MTEVATMNTLGVQSMPINLVGFEKDHYEFDSVVETTRPSIDKGYHNTDPFDCDEENTYTENDNKNKNRRVTNPFDDDSEASTTPTSKIETKDQVETLQTDGGVEFLVVTSVLDRNQEQPSTVVKSSESFDTDDTAPESGVSSDAAVNDEFALETKKLLQMAGERLQYQQKADEIQMLKKHINTMKDQAEIMSEQLRRAIDSKNDLVLAQQEMDDYHERCMSASEEALTHSRAHLRSIEENKAKSDMNFMNEISNLSKQLKYQQDSHRMELAEKDDKIAQLEQQVEQLRAALVRGNDMKVNY